MPLLIDYMGCQQAMCPTCEYLQVCPLHNEIERLRELMDWVCQCEEVCHWYDFFKVHPMQHAAVNWRQSAHIEAYSSRHNAFAEAREALTK